MAIEAHLAELERRHQALEDEINEAQAHPSTDDLTLAELKRRKLLVKDEIARLRQDASIH
ncbi:MAG: YdcH family protein [Terriglobia bacterium]